MMPAHPSASYSTGRAQTVGAKSASGITECALGSGGWVGMMCLDDGVSGGRQAVLAGVCDVGECPVLLTGITLTVGGEVAQIPRGIFRPLGALT